MKKIYTLLSVVKCFGDYKGKPYSHSKGVFQITQINDKDTAVGQYVESIKLSPASAFSDSDAGARGSDPTFDEYGRLVGFSHG